MMVDMANATYVSRVRIERVKGPLRRAWLPAEQEPVLFGVHGAVAEHYKVPADVLEPHATTLDYIVAAAAGWLAGTYGGALEARHIDASAGKLTAEATGEVETEDRVLIIRRIHVVMRLKAAAEDKETAERVHGFFADRCPVYRTLKPAIEITTELVFDAL
jgi:uncharacterized OsmC-like protein